VKESDFDRYAETFFDIMHEGHDYESVAKGYGEYYYDCLPEDLNEPVLDVGCGFADLKAWFGCEHKTVDYTGIDISPDLIAVAKEKQPNTSLYVGELKDARFHALSFDWVLLSGALNEPYNDKGKYTKKIIKEMYRISRRGIAFNLLNKRCINVSDLQSFEPDEMLEFCQTIGAECELRTDYLENDFTIYMRKT